mgnify:CR=1 FL=1
MRQLIQWLLRRLRFHYREVPIDDLGLHIEGYFYISDEAGKTYKYILKPTGWLSRVEEE